MGRIHCLEFVFPTIGYIKYLFRTYIRMRNETICSNISARVSTHEDQVGSSGMCPCL